MEKLYTVNKNKTGSWLWHRPWIPYCQIQTYIVENRENHEIIQVWPESIPLWLYSRSDRFKGSDLIECLRTEVSDIVQETGIKTIPMEKKCQKAKWLSEEALQIAEKKKSSEGKGEKKR